MFLRKRKIIMPSTEKNKLSPTSSTKFFLSNSYCFDNHYNINNKNNNINMDQYFNQQQQKDQYSIAQQNKFVNNNFTEVKLSNQSNYEYKQQHQHKQQQQQQQKQQQHKQQHQPHSQQKLKKQQADGIQNNYLNFSTEVIKSNNGGSLPTNKLNLENSYSPPICTRSASERRRNHTYQKNIYDPITNELNLMTISLPLTSSQEQKQKTKLIDDLENQSLNCPINNSLTTTMSKNKFHYYGLSSSGFFSPDSSNSLTNSTNDGNLLAPQRPLRRCRSASPAAPLLSVEHQTLIKKTWQRVSKTAIGKQIYEKMIEKCKDISDFFEEDYNGIVRHERYFVDLIQSAVDNFTDMEVGLKPWLETVGKGHNGFSIRSRHWDILGEAVVCAISNWIGPSKTRRETIRAWRLLFSYISDRLGTSSRINGNFISPMSNHLTVSSLTSIKKPRIQLLNLVSTGP